MDELRHLMGFLPIRQVAAEGGVQLEYFHIKAPGWVARIDPKILAKGVF